MKYKPGVLLSLESIGTPDLARYIIDELNSVAAIISANSEGRLEVMSVEPVRPRRGQIAYADGTNWNPGAGAGLYFHDGSGWISLPPGYYPKTNWTPVVSFATPGTSSFGAPTVAVGDCTTIGREAFVSFRYSSTVTVGSGSGNLQVTGLPVPAANDANFIWDGAMGAYNGITLPGGRSQLTCSLVANSSIIIFSVNGSAAAPTNLQASDVTGGTITLRGNLRYRWA